MRRLHLRHDAESIEECAAMPPTEAMVTALDAALTFVAARETLTHEQVLSLLALLRVASPISTESSRMYEALDNVEAHVAARQLISGPELVDDLLDARLAVRPPLHEPGATEGARAPLVAV